MKEKTLLQIIPAEGWFAVYELTEPDASPREIALRFPCWGLFEEQEGNIAVRYVRGVEGAATAEGSDSVEDVSNFRRYVHQDDVDWICNRCAALGDCEHRPQRQVSDPSDSPD